MQTETNGHDATIMNAMLTLRVPSCPDTHRGIPQTPEDHVSY